MRNLIATIGLLLLPGMASAVSIDWVAVGDPGNADDTNGYGSVDYAYQMSVYEITNAQYVEFLNAVAATDTYGLYNTGMETSGGISFSGSSGSYTYSAITDLESLPVNFVSFYDGLRFANWLHNGQPTGAQDDTTTEDGSYTITAQGIVDNSITRDLEATVVMPSEDEWYKAANYDTGSMIYYVYPAASDTETTCAAPGATPNTANCDSAAQGLTDVGDYTGSASPNGTFDQGGNVLEWNEAVAFQGHRGQRGGDWDDPATALIVRGTAFAAQEVANVGFRVVTLPEPGQVLLAACALATLVLLRRRAV